MTLDPIREILMWCSIINMGLLIFSILILIVARSWIYKTHSRWFPMTQEQFNLTMYAILGIYKIFIIVFNIVPWAALSIVSP